MGPFIHHSPMEATTSVIVPTLARIAFFNSAALSSEAREREEEGEREGGGKGRKREEGEGRRKRGRVEEGRGEREGEERGRAEYKAGQATEHCRAQATTSLMPTVFSYSQILQSLHLCAALSLAYLPLIDLSH